MPPYARALTSSSNQNQTHQWSIAKPDPAAAAEKLKVLNTEKQLLLAVYELKLNLQPTCSNTAKALRILQKIRRQTPTVLMLKKQPDVVETIKRLRQYVDNGNVYVRKLRASKRVQSAEKVAKIRNLADVIYKQFENMFAFPTTTMQSTPFWTAFKSEVERFQNKCKSLNLDAIDVAALTEEPDEPVECEANEEIRQNTRKNLKNVEHIKSNVIPAAACENLKSKLEELVDRNTFLANELDGCERKIKRRDMELRTLYMKHVNDLICRNNEEIDEIRRELANQQT